MEKVGLVIGRPDTDFVSVTVVGRMHDATDYWDGNWLVSPITVRVKNFAAKVAAGLRAEEIRRFRIELEQLEQSADGGGPAVLASLEDWISVEVTRDGLGHLRVVGTVTDHSAELELSFVLRDLDQTDLPPLLESLRMVEDAYPVFGAPEG